MKGKYLLGILVILGALGYMVFGGLGRNLVYFLTPSEYLQDQARYQNRPVRLGGLVKPGTVQGQGVVVEGRFQEGVFQGTNLLVKHSETYQPPKEGWTPEEVRKLIEEAQ